MLEEMNISGLIYYVILNDLDDILPKFIDQSY